jgi:hypothetical protein
MIQKFKFQLDALFEEQDVHAELIMSVEDMDQLLKTGNASKDIVSPFGSIKNSEYMRQVGNSIYVKKENPFAIDEKSKYIWRLKQKLRTSDDSGSGSGA